MKTLVAAACIAVIALAVYVVGGGIWADKLRADEVRETAFLAQCDALTPPTPAQLAAMTKVEKSRATRLVHQCLDFLKHGTVP